MIKNRQWKRIAALMALASLLGGCGAPSAPPEQTNSGLTVDFLSTGKSDCAVIFEDTMNHRKAKCLYCGCENDPEAKICCVCARDLKGEDRS